MKRIFFLLTVFSFFLAQVMKAQIIIEHNTEVSGTWTKANSPYIINGMVIVPENDSLIIEPGVIVQLKTGDDFNYYDSIINVGAILINGKIKAKGSKDEIILFTRLGEEGNWGNITINSQADPTSEISFSKIEYGNCINTTEFPPSEGNGSLVIQVRGISIKNSIFCNNLQKGININPGTCNINNCIFYKNNIAIYGYGAYNNIYNNTFINNGTAIFGAYLKVTKVINNIICNNEKIIGGWNSALYAKYNLFDSDTLPNMFYKLDEGENIFSKYPQFSDELNNDFRLNPNSPCIDAGDSTMDYSNEPLPNGGRINIGAYGNTSEAASFQPLPRIDNIQEINVSNLGYDTLTVFGKYFLQQAESSYLKVNGIEALKYFNWNDSIISCILPPCSYDTVDIQVKNSDNLIGVRKYFLFYNPPRIDNSSKVAFNTAESDTLSIRGKYFGNQQRQTQLFFGETQITDYVTWSDTLITILTPPNSEGLMELIFKQDSLSFPTEAKYLFSALPVVELCGQIQDTLLKENTYVLTCDCEVPSGKILTVEPGVLVIADHNAVDKVQLLVNGSLNAIGTEHDSIIFKTLVPGKELWNGIIFDNWGTSTLEYVNVSNATSGVTQQDGTLNMDQCRFSDNNIGIYLYGRQEYITSNISNTSTKLNNIGIYAQASCNDDNGRVTANITDCIITNNSENGIEISAGGSTSGYTSSSSGSSVYFNIKNSEISYNQGNAVDIDSRGYSRDGIPFDKSRYATIVFTSINNLIYSNSKGIYMYRHDLDYSTLKGKMVNTVLQGNNSTFTLDADEWFVQNSILWDNNQSSAPTGDCDSLVVNNSNLNSLDWITHGSNNISEDPQYISPATGDFTLQPTSPCIDAGANEFATFEKDFDGKVRIWDGNGDGTTTVDIGAYEFGSIAETAPLITSQLAGGSFCPGSTLELSVEVTAYPEPDYQWYRNDTLITGATENILSLSSSLPGSYTCTITNSVGSVATEPAEVDIYPEYEINMEQSICQGESFEINGHSYTSDTIVIQNLVTVNGCDSTVTTHLTVHLVYEMEEEVTICEGASYKGWTEPGTFTENLVSVSGCDSTMVTRLSVNDAFEVSEEVEICAGESYLEWTETGTYSRTLQSVSGCDSTVTMHLTVHPVYEVEKEITICEGTSYKGWTETGTYTENLVSVFGCDSTVVTRLSVNDAFEVTEEVEICAGESYLEWNEPGTYFRTLQSVSGCDSTVTTHLTVHPVYEMEEEITICKGDSYKGWTQPGTYTENLVSVFGCDSTVVTQLSVIPLPATPVLSQNADTLTASGEGVFTWYFEDNLIEGAISSEFIIEESGSYSVTVTSGQGCVSDVSESLYVVKTTARVTELNNLKVYPNPTTGKVTIEGIEFAVKTMLSVSDNLGRELFKREVHSTRAEVDLAGFAPGIYNITVVQGSHRAGFQVVKQ